MSGRIDFLNVPVDLMSSDAVLARIDNAIRTRCDRIRIEGVNVAKVVEAREDAALMSALREAEIVHTDGAGVALGLRLAGHAVERHAGIDLMHDLFALGARNGYSVFLLGAREEVLQQAAATATRAYPGLRIAGLRNGYFNEADEPAIAAAIRDSGADMLFIGISSPKKELFVKRNWARLGVSLAMGVGGSFDVLAGKVRRAPRWLQEAHLEWAFRLIQEPRRLLRRYFVTNSVYLALLGSMFLGRMNPFAPSDRRSGGAS